MQPLRPEIGNWYKLGTGELFEVVAIDRHDRTIEIQHYDGSIDEYDYDSWKISNITAATQPEDWSGAYDMTNADYGVERESHNIRFHGNELDQFK